MGYKYECTDEVIHEFVDWLQHGATLTMACDRTEGITMDVYQRWMGKGAPQVTEDGEVVEEGEEPYATFRSKVLEAKGVAEKEALRRIKAAKSWKSDAWLLERTRGDDYEKNAQKHEHEVKGSVTVTLPDNGRDS